VDIFGSTSPAKMPSHFFWGVERLAYETAVRADIDRQNYSVAPRYWYIDAEVVCDSCGTQFVFSASEQEKWYETYRFYVDSFPRKCITCRRTARHIRHLRQEYDANITKALSTHDKDLKKTVVEIINALEECGSTLQHKIEENRDLLLKQLK